MASVSKSMMRRMALGVLAAAVLPMTGCVGIYKNSDRFFNLPATDSPENKLMETYGIPDVVTKQEEKTVYGYKVRDNKYIICVGIYDGFDVLVTCEKGKVVGVTKLQRPQTFTLFQPIPWAEGNE